MPKVRLGAQVLRLPRGEKAWGESLVARVSPASIGRDSTVGRSAVSGACPTEPPPKPPRITGEVGDFMEEKLSEGRTWNVT